MDDSESTPLDSEVQEERRPEPDPKIRLLIKRKHADVVAVCIMSTTGGPLRMNKPGDTANPSQAIAYSVSLG